MLFVFIWAITKGFIENDWVSVIKYNPFIFYLSNWKTHPYTIFSQDQSSDINVKNLWQNCPWMKPHTVDWIYQGPITVVLALNSIFLIAIMWVLITKLRSANTLETQQYRKAAKALLVLKPLLGVTYVLTIAGPTAGSTGNIFDYTRAVLLSLQVNIQLLINFNKQFARLSSHISTLKMVASKF